MAVDEWKTKLRVTRKRMLFVRADKYGKAEKR